jgi:hypothetical protein
MTPSSRSVFMDLRESIDHSDVFRNHRMTLPILLDLFDIEISEGYGKPLTDVELGARYYSRLKDDHDRVRRVHKAMVDTRKGLQAYFSSAEGRRKPFAVDIVLKMDADLGEAVRRLELSENHPPPPNALELFWEPYLGQLKNNMVIFTEPLFYRRKGDLTYVRNVHWNEENPLTPLTPIISNSDEWERSYHYMSSGEVMAILRLVSALGFRSNWPPAQQGAATGSPQRGKQDKTFQCSFATAREATKLTALEGINLVIIGSSRTNWMLKSLQTAEDFTVDEKGIRVGASSIPQYSDAIDTVPLYKYAVLTRKVSDHGNHRAIVLIAANHGRAAEALMNRITDHTELAGLYRSLSLSDKLPDHLQVLFRVRISKDRGEAEIEEVTPVDWRLHYREPPPQPTPGSCQKCGRSLKLHESHYWGCP